MTTRALRTCGRRPGGAPPPSWTSVPSKPPRPGARRYRGELSANPAPLPPVSDGRGRGRAVRGAEVRSLCEVGVGCAATGLWCGVSCNAEKNRRTRGNSFARTSGVLSDSHVRGTTPPYAQHPMAVSNAAAILQQPAPCNPPPIIIFWGDSIDEGTMHAFCRYSNPAPIPEWARNPFARAR